jgi:hypothetical protein
VAARLAVGLNVYHRKNQNLFGNFNDAVPLESYTPVTINNPLTNQPLVIYNQAPATVGRQRNVWRNTDLLENHYTGFDLAVSWRFGNGGLLQGGYGYGSKQGSVLGGIPTSTDLNDPNNVLVFPEGAVDFDQPHRVKITGAYTLPWDITLGAYFYNTSGVPKVRTGSFNRTQVPNLSRPSQTVRLEESGDTRYERVMLLDLRFGRVFRAGRYRIEPFVDLYNVFNANTVLAEGTIYTSTSLGVATETVMARFFKLGIKFDF